MGQKQLTDKIIETVINSGNLTERDALYLTVECWKYCERTSQTDTFPFLRFFRNWCVHTTIDKKLHNSISTVLLDTSKESDEKMKALLQGLENEITELLAQLGVDMKSHIDYMQFVTVLLDILSEQPVDYDVKRFSLIINEETKQAIIWEKV